MRIERAPRSTSSGAFCHETASGDCSSLGEMRECVHETTAVVLRHPQNSPSSSRRFFRGGCHGTLGDGSVDQRPARGQWAVYLKEAVKGAKNSQVRNEPVQVVGVAFDRIRRKTHLQISPSAPKNDSKTIPLTIQKAYHSRFISWSPICLLGSHCRAQLVRLEISDQGLRRPRNLQPEQHGEMGNSRIPLDPEVCRGGS
jgi:hypothetical protein